MEEKKSMSTGTSSLYERIKARVPSGAQADLYERTFTAKERGEPMAWTSFCVPSELFWAMDIAPMYVENTCAVPAATPEGVTKYIDLGEQYIPDHICSLNKVMVGAAIAGELPVPDLIVYPSVPCDSGMITYSTLAEFFGVPYFCIDVPCWKDERTYQYIARELERLVSFMEEHTKRKLDFDKLKQVMEYSNLAHKYILEINEFRKAVPCPISFREELAEAARFRFTGTPEIIDYLRERCEVLRDRVAKRQSPLEQEKVRLLWMYVWPIFDPSIFSWLGRQYGAVSIRGMGNMVFKPVEDISSTEKILRGLAEKLTLMIMVREVRGPWENYRDVIVEAAREYKADAAVFAGHLGCKNSWAIQKLLKDSLTDELGIPSLVFEVDAADPRVTSSDDIKAKFDDFFELILSK